METEPNTLEVKTDKKNSIFSKVLSFVIYIWILAMMFIFVAIMLFIDYVSYSVIEELKSVKGDLPNPLVVNVDATSFTDYFIRYQLITVLIGIVAFIVAVKFIGFIIRASLIPMYNGIRENRRQAWRNYLNSGFTYSDLTEQQKTSINLRRFAIDHDLYLVLTLINGFLFATFMVVFFFALGYINEPSADNTNWLILGGFIILSIVFVEWGRKRKRPLSSIEKRIKNDVEWKEWLEKHDKEEAEKIRGLENV